MLTYFLEGENVSHRQRRISHSKFSRQNSPNSCDIDGFGAPTIHPKYWSNGSIPSPTHELNVPLFNCDIEHGDITHAENGNNNSICDPEDILSEIYIHNDTSDRDTKANLMAGSTSANADKVCPFTSQDKQNPFSLIDTRSPVERRISDNTYLLANGRGGVTDENTLSLKKLELTRNSSLPLYMFEEDSL